MTYRTSTVLAFLGFLCSAGFANAQSDRVQEMNRVVDGLTSANPIVRLATLEEAIAASDANLRNLAIQTALASDDALLRSTAFSGLFGSKKSFIVEVAPVDGEDYYANFANRALGNRMEVFLSDFDPSDGSFKARTAWSRIVEDNKQKDYVWEDGVFSGSRVSFMVDMTRMNPNYNAPCRGSADGDAGGFVLVGKMACEQGSYDIKIDILN